jgi:hypothetical protein
MYAMTIAALVFAAALGAVSRVEAQQTAAATPADQERPGYGVVESITALRPAPAEESASAGASAPGRRKAAGGTYLVRVRLDDGSIQIRNVKKRAYKVGDRVLISNAGDIVRD